MKMITRMLAVAVAMGMLFAANPEKAEAAYACTKTDGTIIGYSATKAGCTAKFAALGVTGNPVGVDDKNLAVSIQGFLDNVLVKDFGVVGFDAGTGLLTLNLSDQFTASEMFTRQYSSIERFALNFKDIFGGANPTVRSGSVSYMIAPKTGENPPGAAAVPEPSTIMLIAAGAAGLAGMGYRRRKSAGKN